MNYPVTHHLRVMLSRCSQWWKGKALYIRSFSANRVGSRGKRRDGGRRGRRRWYMYTLCDLRISIRKRGNSLKLVNYKSAMSSMFTLARYLTWWFIKPLVSRCCVSNLTRMLQTSSFNQTHVLVASNSISLSSLEGKIYIITLLNPLQVLNISLTPLPVLVALKILRYVLSFTRSFIISYDKYSSASWVSRTLRPKVKQLRIIPRIALSRLVCCSSRQCPNLNVSGSETWLPICIAKLSRNRHCAYRTDWLEWLLNHPQW